MTESRLTGIAKHPYFKKAIRSIFLAVAVFLLGIFFIQQEMKKRGEQDDIRHSAILRFTTMSTNASVWIKSEEEHDLDNGFRSVKEDFQAVERHFNIFDPQSELAKLNEQAAKQPFVCSEELWELLQLCRKFHQLSNGAFDVTITPLMSLWGFHRREKQLPSEAEVMQAKKLVGMDKIEFNDANHSVRFSVPGMKLDLGGIAKGWALDKAAAHLNTNPRIKSGYLDLGGNVLLIGTDAPKNGFPAEVQDPLDPNRTCAEFSMREGAVATSGNYERYVTINGKQYTHIIDPRSGKPVEGMLSVTVITKKGVDSDALSTILFILGPDAVEPMRKVFPDLKVLMIRRRADQTIETLSFGSGWEKVRTPGRS